MEMEMEMETAQAKRARVGQTCNCLTSAIWTAINPIKRKTPITWNWLKTTGETVTLSPATTKRACFPKNSSTSSDSQTWRRNPLIFTKMKPPMFQEILAKLYRGPLGASQLYRRPVAMCLNIQISNCMKSMKKVKYKMESIVHISKLN